jgi:hypothetical protein
MGRTRAYREAGKRITQRQKKIPSAANPLWIPTKRVFTNQIAFATYFVSAAFGAPAFAGTTLTFFWTKPERRQRVQIWSVIVVPLSSVFTLMRFGLQVRRVWLYELLTL